VTVRAIFRLNSLYSVQFGMPHVILTMPTRHTVKTNDLPMRLQAVSGLRYCLFTGIEPGRGIHAEDGGIS
jgi:hypothetical protein